MKSLKSRLDAISRQKALYEKEMKEIKDYIESDLRPVIENLQLNQLITICEDVTPLKLEFPFNKEFIVLPDVFVITNQFKIEYSTSKITLKKIKIMGIASQNHYAFNAESLKSSSTPVCMLIVEKI